MSLQTSSTMLLAVLLTALISQPLVVLAYPGRSLQARAISPDNTCGGTNGYTCPASLPCCSKYNWCGTTDAYCGVGCQASFGTCSVAGSSSSTTPSPPAASSAAPGGGVSPDNTCGGTKGYICPGTLPCCSKYNWCGSTVDYCGAGCQAAFGTCSIGGTTSIAPNSPAPSLPTSSTKPPSQPSSSTPPPPASSGNVSPDNTCGGTNGYTCPSTLPCCSKYNWCGSTGDYCGAGCQAAFGICMIAGSSTSIAPNSPAPSLPTSSTIPPSQPSSSTSPPPASSGQVSPDNTCGGTNGYICPGTLPCCSKYNWCGSTVDYCGSGCQIAFGTCSVPGTASQPAGSSSQPSGPTPTGGTSSIPRPKIGSVPYGSVITSCIHPGDIAITFDDGPYIYTPDLLDLLARYNIKSTFFLIANNGNGQIDQTPAWTSIIRRMYNEGHQVASHTYDHPDLTTLTSAQRKDEMYKCEAALANILGFFPTYMRPPYLAFNSDCQTDMSDLGYHVISTNLDTKDYANDSPDLIQTSKDKFDAGIAADPASSNFIVLNHDIHYQTVYNLTEYEIQHAIARGYRPVTVGQCLGDPVANWYRSAAVSKRRAVEARVGNVTVATPVGSVTVVSPIGSATVVPAVGGVTTEDLKKLGIKPPIATCVYVDAPSSVVRMMKRARLLKGEMSEAIY